jgi:hypothetical protein
MKINQKWLIFFVAKKVIQSLKERMVLEMKIKLKSLERKIMIVCYGDGYN